MTDVAIIEPLVAPPATTVEVPGSRSVTNRALVCAALANGTSRLRGVLDADDTGAMLDCLAELGVGWRRDDPTTLVVDGCDGRPAPGPRQLYTRLSGTTSRFVTAMCALGSGEYVIDAAGPMRARPMAALLDALVALGVDVESAAGHLPVTVRASRLAGGQVRLRGDVSSQFLSALLLAGAATRDGLRIELDGPLKSVPYVEMTRRVMASFGGVAERGGGYLPTDYAIEPDASTACYFWAAAAVTGGTVRVEGLTADAMQGDVAFVDVLESMGCTVDRSDGGISVRGPSRLRAVDVDLADISDQAPTFAVVAAFAEGTSVASGIGFIRRKESDRLAAAVEGLGHLGVRAEELPDGLRIGGCGGAPPHGGRIRTFDDHRIAMSFAIAGLAVAGVEIEDPACVAKTAPDFFDRLDRLRVSA